MALGSSLQPCLSSVRFRPSTQRQREETLWSCPGAVPALRVRGARSAAHFAQDVSHGDRSHLVKARACETRKDGFDSRRSPSVSVFLGAV